MASQPSSKSSHSNRDRYPGAQVDVYWENGKQRRMKVNVQSLLKRGVSLIVRRLKPLLPLEELSSEESLSIRSLLFGTGTGSSQKRSVRRSQSSSRSHSSSPQRGVSLTSTSAQRKSKEKIKSTKGGGSRATTSRRSGAKT